MRNHVAISMLLIAIAPMVIAGEASEDRDVARLEKVTIVASKVERPLREVAGVVTLVDAEMIEEWLVQDVADIVRYEPGVTVNREAGRFGLGGYTIRGVSGNRVLVEVDGVPVSESFSIGDFSSAGRNLVDPEVLGRVEILRGPASALYGSDALGGVVVYRTRDPRDFLRSANTVYRAKLTYDGADDGAAVTGLVANRADAFDTLALVNIREGDERDASGAQGNPADVSSRNALVKLVRYDANGAPMRVTLDAHRASRETEMLALVGAPGRFATTTRLEGNDDSARYRFSVEKESEPGLRWLESYVWRLHHQQTEFEQHTVQELAAGGMTPYPSRRNRQFAYEQRTSGGEFTAENALRLGGFDHALVYGIEINRSVVTEMRDAMLTNLDSGTTTNILLGEEFPLRDFPVSRKLEAGIYLQDEIRRLDGEWTLIPALRFEYYDLQPRSDETYRVPVEPVSIRETELTPRLGAVRQLGEHSSYFLQYSRGFRAPPFEDVNIGLDLPLFGVRAIPNPDLSPERSDSFETGIRYATAPAGAELSLFYSEYDNLIESRVPLGFDPVSGLLLFQSQNREEARIHGAEFRGYLNLSAVNAALDGWRVDLAAGVTRGKDTARDEWLNSIDPDRLVLGIGYRHAEDRWRVELITTAVSSMERVDDSAGDLYQPAGYAVMDLIGHVAFNDSWRLNWGLFNVADRQYWHWSDVRGLDPLDPTVALAAQPGRHARVSLRYDW